MNVFYPLKNSSMHKKNSGQLPVAISSVIFTVTQDEEGNEKSSHEEEDRIPVIQTVHYLYIQVSLPVALVWKGGTTRWN